MVKTVHGAGWAMIRFFKDRIFFSESSTIRWSFLRILIGLIIVFHTSQYFFYDLINDRLMDTTLLLKYPFFYWVPTLTGSAYYLFFATFFLSGLGILFNCQVLISTSIAWLSVSYLLLFNQFYYYDDHYSLWGILSILLLSFLFFGVTKYRDFSTDSATKSASSAIAFLRIQHIIILVFVAIAKCHLHWINGEFLKLLLQNLLFWKLLISGLNLSDSFWQILSILILVMQFYLPVGLLIKKLRKSAIILGGIQIVVQIIVFKVYVANSIDMWPVIMTAFLLLWVSEDRLINCLNGVKRIIHNLVDKPTVLKRQKKGRLIYPFIIIFFTLQILFPLSRYCMQGDPIWTHKGQFFAWRMRLFFYETDSIFGIYNKEGELQDLNINLAKLLGDGIRENMNRPYVIYKAALIIEEELIKNYGFEDPQIKSHVKVSVSGRPFHYIVDPEVDLTTVKYHLFSDDEWILPRPW